jgi:predicted enzyme related to lactoylglutathione lyase
MGDPVMHFEIVGKDAPALRAFYRDVFGWQIGESMPGANVPDYTLVHPDAGRGIDGGIAGAPPGYAGHVTVYIDVASVASALQAIELRGGSTMMPPQNVPGGFAIALFEDPEGHVIGLRQSMPLP